MSKQSLDVVADELDHMRSAAVEDGYPMLALLLQLARDEARDVQQSPSAKPKKPQQPEPASNVIPFPVQRVRNRSRKRRIA